MTSAPPVPQDKESPPLAPPPNPSWWRTTWPILIGILITIGLIIASLFIGVYR